MGKISFDLKSRVKSIWIGRIIFVFGSGIYGIAYFEKDLETEVWSIGFDIDNF